MIEGDEKKYGNKLSHRRFGHSRSAIESKPLDSHQGKIGEEVWKQAFTSIRGEAAAAS